MKILFNRIKDSQCFRYIKRLGTGKKFSATLTGFLLITLIVSVYIVQRPKDTRLSLGYNYITYPQTHTTINDLNPIYAPFVGVNKNWYMDSSYDRDGVNNDGKGYIREENDKYVLAEKSGSGYISRIWFAQPVHGGLDGEKSRLLEIITDDGGNKIFLQLEDKVAANTQPYVFPLIADAKYSSGGLISYVPIRFTGSLKVLSTVPNGYFQINYVTTTDSVSDAGGFDVLAAKWVPVNMGKTADYLSVNSPVFSGLTTVSSTHSISEGQTKVIFEKPGEGTIARIQIPASQIQDNLNNLRLKIEYLNTTLAAVDLPLNLLFTANNADFTPSLPPFENIDSHVFSPTGKEVVVKGNSVWVREPWLETYNVVGENKNWYRMSLSSLLQSGGNKPQIESLDTFSINTNGAETVVKGGDYWYRSNAESNWYKGLLSNAWPGSSSNGYPLPHNNIDSHSFNLSGNETVISGDRYWSRPTTASPWWSNTLDDAWGMSPQVEGHSFSPLGETVISGSQYWSRFNPSYAWSTNTLQHAWSNSSFYTGSIFFGYDGTTDRYYITWPIPYWGGVRLSLQNQGQTSVSVSPRITWTTQTYDPDTAGYLNVTVMSGTEESPTDLYPAADISGEGKVVGILLSADGDPDPINNRTFLEGDEEVVVDGVVRGRGTGIEDIFNGGWYFIHGPFYMPTHGASLSPNSRLQSPIPSDTKKLGLINTVHPTRTLMYRHLLNDAIYFKNSFYMNYEYGPFPNYRLIREQETFFNGAVISYIRVPAPTSTPVPTNTPTPQPTTISTPTVAPSPPGTKSRLTPTPLTQPSPTPTPTPTPQTITNTPTPTKPQLRIIR